MSPKDDDDIRKLILERRARFLAAALTTTGLQACTLDTGPSVCLSIAVTPSTFNPLPTSTSATSSGTATATNASTSTTTSQVNSCRNPPACVCLSIVVSHPEPPVAPPGTTTDETSVSSVESPEAGVPSAPSDAGDGGVDAGNDGGTSTDQTTTASDSSHALTEPTVCLSLLVKRK